MSGPWEGAFDVSEPNDFSNHIEVHDQNEGPGYPKLEMILLLYFNSSFKWTL